MVGTTTYKVWVVLSCKVLPELKCTQEIAHFIPICTSVLDSLIRSRGDLKTLKTCPVSASIDIRMLVLYITLVTVLIGHLFSVTFSMHFV